MDAKYTNSTINSAEHYFYDLQYLGKNNKEFLSDLMLLVVVNNVYNWADWFEVSEANKIKLQKFMDCLILNNSNLVFPVVLPGTYYSNVSTPQTIHTWQRVYDNLLVETYETIPEPPPTP